MLPQSRALSHSQHQYAKIARRTGRTGIIVGDEDLVRLRIDREPRRARLGRDRFEDSILVARLLLDDRYGALAVGAERQTCNRIKVCFIWIAADWHRRDSVPVVRI